MRSQRHRRNKVFIVNEEENGYVHFEIKVVQRTSDCIECQCGKTTGGRGNSEETNTISLDSVQDNGMESKST